ncbi:F-box/WD repeat-containing protein 5 isoform X1 [Nilaparvata lugens]|uniref:F-box/WD repeat-containing protein 5 isoform X1 n=1 Tax=Nilaparvata lugens TaxID=108931 RepID=UPI00193D8C44|nr:F-box/WD repeat-containing protein 5 isoform X1 [Nilaparvata lugens]
MDSSNSEADKLWNYAPDIILLDVFQYLDATELLKAGKVCRRWNRLSMDEMLWKALFYKDFKIDRNIGIMPNKTSWLGEYKRLTYETPMVNYETLRSHSHQVLHVSFAHNGSMFATTSKDGYIIVWESKFPVQMKFHRDMKSFSWQYTQFSQFNQSDTLLLVSGVHFGAANSTSGEIAVFSLQDGFELQCRVKNKPYDIFGTWYSDRMLLSGDLRWLAHLVSSSGIWLNKASQETASEHTPIMTQLCRFYNTNGSSVRAIMVANCLIPDDTAAAAAAISCQAAEPTAPSPPHHHERGNPPSHRDLDRRSCSSKHSMHDDDKPPCESRSGDKQLVSRPTRGAGRDQVNMPKPKISKLTKLFSYLSPKPVDRHPGDNKKFRQNNLFCKLVNSHPVQQQDMRRRRQFVEEYNNLVDAAIMSGQDYTSSIFYSNNYRQVEKEKEASHSDSDSEGTSEEIEGGDSETSELSVDIEIEEDLARQPEKLLIFTTGSKTYSPHQIGLKRIKRVTFPRVLDPGPSLSERIEERRRKKELLRARRENSSLEPDPDWLNFKSVSDKFDTVDHIVDLHGHIIGMGLSPDHRYLYVNSRPWPRGYEIKNPLDPPPIAQEIDLHVIDLVTLQEVGTMLRSHKAYTPNNECFFIFLDVCDEYVASGAEDKNGYLWDRHYGMCLAKYPHQDVVNSVAFNPRDSGMLVTTSDDSTIKVWRSHASLRRLLPAPIADCQHMPKAVRVAQNKANRSARPNS